MAAYCISDIHGCSKTLKALLDLLPLVNTDTVYFLGDYVDRGPDSKGVLNIVMSMTNAVCHKGNHEDMMLKSLSDPTDYDARHHWMINGSHATITSFGGRPSEKYLAFLQSLKMITELPKFYLCHAGIWRNAMSTPEEVLLWDRDCDVDIKATGGRRLVCGHTPTSLYMIQSGLEGNKLVIDGGCVYKGRPGLGSLIALRLDDMGIFAQPNID